MLFWRNRLRNWATPIALLWVAGLSYGLWIPWLGLFGDDLPYMWYYHLLGPWGPGEFAAMDRPISSLFYAAATLFLGERVWAYHVLLLILRWLSGVMLWWVLRLVWPDRDREAGLAGLLFVVYPGFRQNPIALEFILHTAVLDLFLVSLGTMLLAARSSRRRVLWIVISAVTAAGPFFLEYFVGLEILRPIFLWFITRRQGQVGKKQWSAILKAWLLPLIVVLAFLTWRIFFFSFTVYQPVLLDRLRAAPLSGLLSLGRTIVHDLWISLGSAWASVFTLPGTRRQLLLALLLLAGSSGVVVLLLGLARRSSSPQPVQEMAGSRYWGEQMLVIGMLAMLAGGSIFWITGIQVSTEFPWDRSTLSFMLGASLVGVGILEMVVSPRYRFWVAALLIGLAVSAHYQNALVYRAEWTKLQNFAWQLTWRAPGLQPGTLVLFDVIPLNRYSDNDLTALLNWTYAPQLDGTRIPYKFFDLTIRLDSEYDGLPALEKDLPVEHNHRGVFFKTTTSNTLAVHYNPPGCLVVLSPEDNLLPGIPERLVRALPITRLDQILPDAGQALPPEQIGAEPPHDWCYYYQKAGLARQQGDWEQVAVLGEQAFTSGLHWNDPLELLPFIEGYAGVGNWVEAARLTVEAGSKVDLQPALCALWENIREKQGASLPDELSSTLAVYGCAP